ncbi:hypothetical protein ACV30Q_15315 [Clostridium perfringens]|uniref:hypothetical protein n=1 Tax=Clostridium perfringens TaxID=1502 RepID=UPI0018E47064|nr:hypothetical protein [Clostridium perfringens]MBI5993066.1 hypothetical protein [Clostridium perfringens]MDK0724423.1 hypothetical protein [Clostridium perfringens]
MDYKKYFEELKKELKGLKKTNEVTNKIKEYTKNFESNKDKIVLYSNNGGEFLYDISVLTFNPNNIIKGENKKITINDRSLKYNSFLLVESELGGESASSALGVFRNVVKDFLKLIIGNSRYKVMIMAISAYKDEVDYIKNRLEVLSELYERSECNSDILIIAIEGYHKDGRGQIKLDTSKMHYEILSKDK